MPSIFSDLLRHHLGRAGFSVRDMAVAASTSRSAVDHAVHERNKPPLDQMERWADALSLAGKDREVFLLEAKLAHAPDDVAALARELIAARDQLLAQVPLLERVVAEADALRAENAQLRAEVDRLRARSAR